MSVQYKTVPSYANSMFVSVSIKVFLYKQTKLPPDRVHVQLGVKLNGLVNN